MGLIVSIYRDNYDSDLNAFRGFDKATVINVSGPFDPTPDAPAARLERNARGSAILVPEAQPGEGLTSYMFGGTYAATSDSRWREATGIYGAVPIHDRSETYELYNALSQ